MVTVKSLQKGRINIILYLLLEAISIVRWFFTEDLSKEEIDMLQRNASMSELERTMKNDYT